jgi:hypothetical protein
MLQRPYSHLSSHIAAMNVHDYWQSVFPVVSLAISPPGDRIKSIINTNVEVKTVAFWNIAISHSNICNYTIRLGITAEACAQYVVVQHLTPRTL